MPEDYGQGYGNGYPQQPQQPMPQQMGGQPPYGYDGGYPQGGQPMPGQQMPMNGQYGYPGQPQKKGLGVGTIIGIVVGIVALLALVLFLFLRPSSDGGDPTDGQDTPTTTSQPADDDADNGSDADVDEDADADADLDASTDGTAGQDTASGSASPSGVTVDVNALSDDWTVGEVNIAGVGYRLFESNYADLVANGWAISEYSSAHDTIENNGGSFIINASEWTTFTFDNPAYPDCSLTVGLGNTGNAPANYDQCVITYLDARIPYFGDSMYEFAISKGIKLGMTDADVIAAFGMPDENGHVYEDDGSGFKTMSYVVVGNGEAFNRNYYRLELSFQRGDDGQYRIREITIGI